MNKQGQPPMEVSSNRAPSRRADRLKVHRRSVVLDGTPYTVLSPRPDVEHRFATNRFHQTWHILSSTAGGRFFGRLLWAMAFQQARTVFVIDSRFIVPNLFDADPSVPIVIHNPDSGPFNRAQADDLRAALPWKTRSEGTVTLQTHGLDRYVAQIEFDDCSEVFDDNGQWNRHQYRSWVELSQGFIVVAASRRVLVLWATDCLQMTTSPDSESGYVELDPMNTWRRWGDGEVQVFERFIERVRVAQRNRERLFPGRAHTELAPDEREQLWALGGGEQRGQ